MVHPRAVVQNKFSSHVHQDVNISSYFGRPVASESTQEATLTSPAAKIDSPRVPYGWSTQLSLGTWLTTLSEALQTVNPLVTEESHFGSSDEKL